MVAPAGTDLMPVLTSTPFGAVAGQPVTHTIALSGAGTGTMTAVRVTFTTTVGLDGVRASASQGSCPTVTAVKVVCERGDVGFPGTGAAAPTVTVTGAVDRTATPGALVQNLVEVTSTTPDADAANNAVTNAYLIPGGSTAPQSTGGPVSARPAASRSAAPVLLGTGALGLAALGLGGLAVVLLLVRRRRRRSRARL
jgi:hypothetical protein